MPHHLVPHTRVIARSMSRALPALVLALAQPALAASLVYRVDTTRDLPDARPGDGVCAAQDHHCSLRAAIMESNRRPPGTSLSIVMPGGTYVLDRGPSGGDGDDTGDLNLLDRSVGGTTDFGLTDISRADMFPVVIDGAGLDSVLTIASNRSVALVGLTIRHSLSHRAAVTNDGDTRFLYCILEQNVSLGNAGALANNAGTLTLYHSMIRDNVALSGAGALVFGGRLVASHSTFSRNAASQEGGAIAISGTAEAYLIDTTLSENVAAHDGGALFNAFGATTFLYNVTIVGNDADHDADETIGGAGGGIFSKEGGRLVLVNTLLAWNTVRNIPVYSDCHGHVESYGTNLLGELNGCDTTDTPLGLVSLSSVDPTLRDNGGWVPTHALLAGSEAIDSTRDVGCVDQDGATLESDAREGPRHIGIRCDVGAYEFGSTPLVIDALFAYGFD